MNGERNKTGIIFNIQKFSVNDGPGIRTVVFLKGCPLRCPWCANPESQYARIQLFHDEKKCIACGHCADVCPKQAVIFEHGAVRINPRNCDACGRCVKECPMHALSVEGEVRSVQEIIDVVKQDEVFYEESGGGMTLSGGELLAQPEFAAALLKAAKEEGINTCCETTGQASDAVFTSVLPYLDTMMYDLKHYDPDAHRTFTGVSNDLPVRHLRMAAEAGKDVLPRIPVIPGFNAELKDAEGFSDLLKEIGIRKCQLLPFHQFGENKYHLLHKDYAYENRTALHREDLEDYRQVFVTNGIDAFF